MSDEKHSPGPWHVHELGLADWPRSPFNPWKRRMIAMPKPEGAGPEVKFGHTVAEINSSVGDYDRGDADARLIAAAPEMLALLRDLIRCDDARLMLRPDNDMGVAWHLEARALLARIDGQR